MPAILTLHPPGAALESALLPRLVEAIEAGDDVWYVAPDARARSARLRGLSQRLCVLDPPIGTLRDFALRVLRRAGEPLPPRTDPALAWLFERQAFGTAFPDHPVTEGMARLGRSALRELEDDGWTARTLAERAGGDSLTPPVRLVRAWSALTDGYPEADAASPIRTVLEEELVPDAAPRLLLVEGGAVTGELGARLLRVLVEATLARSGEVVAACPDLPAGRGRHARGLALLRRVIGDGGVPAAAPEGTAPGIAALGGRLFRAPEGSSGDPAPAGDVIRLHAPEDEAVADLIAREVREILATSPDPESLLDGRIAVVCPETRDRERMQRVLARLGVPVAREARAAMAATPGGRWILTLLRLLEEGPDAPASAVIDLLTSDAWGYPLHAQHIVARRLARGGAARAADIPDLLPAGRSRTRLERILRAAGELRTCSTAAGYGEVLRVVLPPVAARAERDQCAPLRAAWRRHGARHVTSYSAPLRRLEGLLAALEEVARRSGVEPSLSTWMAELRGLIGASETGLGTAPSRGIRLESPGRISPADYLFIVGLVEGRFPGLPRRHPFLTEDLRERLAGTELGPRAMGDFADEQREAFLLACGAVRRRLYLCHPRADAEGREVLRSFWIDDVAEALGAGPLPQVGRARRESVPALVRAWGPAELRAAAAASLHDDSAGADQRDTVRRAVDDLRQAGVLPAPAALPSWRVAQLGERERAWLAERAARVSFTQLDRYAHCAFRHFIDSRLEPDGLDTPVFDARARGERVHAWLWEVGTTPDGWEHPGVVLDALFARPEPPETPPSLLAGASSRAALEQWKRRVRAWAEDEAARIRTGDFRPAHHELGFGRRTGGKLDPASRPDPIELDLAGTTILLAGAVDRIDVWKDGDGTRWGVAIDYKTGPVADRAKWMRTGRDLQLPLYLHVLEAFGIRPAGALYLSVRDGSIAGVVRAGIAPRLGALPATVTAAGEAEWEALRGHADGEVARLQREMRAGRLQVWPRDGDCEMCEHRGICRIDLRSAREEAYA